MRLLPNRSRATWSTQETGRKDKRGQTPRQGKQGTHTSFHTRPDDSGTTHNIEHALPGATRGSKAAREPQDQPTRWDIFYPMLGQFCNHFSTILKQFWDHPRIILGSFEIILESFSYFFFPLRPQRLYQNDGKGLHGNVPDMFERGY